MKIIVYYNIDKESMTDEDYENQEENEFEITEDMIHDLIMQNSDGIERGDTIDINNIRKE